MPTNPFKKFARSTFNTVNSIGSGIGGFFKDSSPRPSTAFKKTQPKVQGTQVNLPFTPSPIGEPTPITGFRNTTTPAVAKPRTPVPQVKNQVSSATSPTVTPVQPPKPPTSTTSAPTSAPTSPQAPKTFTTPSGAVVDAQGRLVSGPKPQAPTGTPTSARATPTPTPTVRPTATPTPRPEFTPSETDPKVTALREQVAGSFAQTPQETNLSERLNAILTGSELGQEKIRTQPIATPFLTGQAAALERQTNLKAAPLQRQLTLIQQQREQAQKASLLQLGFAEEDAERIAQERTDFEEKQEGVDTEIKGIARNLINAGATQKQVDSVLASGSVDDAFGFAASTGLLGPEEETANEIRKQELELEKLEAQIAAIDDPLDRALKTAQIAQVRANTAKTIQSSNPETTNQQIIGGVAFTPNSTATADDKKKITTLLTGVKLVDQIERLYETAVGDEAGTANVGTIGNIQQLLKFRELPLPFVDNPQLRQSFGNYTDFLKSNRAPIAKGIKGEVGNLAEKEQENALKSFPSAIDTPRQAEVKFEEIRKQMVDQLSVLGQFDGQPDFGGMGDSIENDFNSFVTEEE